MGKAHKDTYILFDSSVWVAYLYEKDVQHNKAVSLFKSLQIEKFIVTEYVLLEVLSILQLKVSKKAANNFLTFCFSDQVVFIESNAFLKNAVRMFPTSDKKLSFVDISLLVLSKNYTVMIFDRHLEKAIRQKHNS